MEKTLKEFLNKKLESHMGGLEPHHVRFWLKEYDLHRLEYSNCEHIWKYDEFGQFGQASSKYCEKCEIVVDIY